jgi:hypothetical protein
MWARTAAMAAILAATSLVDTTAHTRDKLA